MTTELLQEKRRRGGEEQELRLSDAVRSSDLLVEKKSSRFTGSGLQISAAILNGQSHSIRLLFSSSPVKKVAEVAS